MVARTTGSWPVRAMQALHHHCAVQVAWGRKLAKTLDSTRRDMPFTRKEDESTVLNLTLKEDDSIVLNIALSSTFLELRPVLGLGLASSEFC